MTTGTTTNILGHPTWIEDRPGPGSPVLLLHGGLSNSDSMLDSIGPAINAQHRVLAFDRRGHGRTADTDAPFHYDDMASETIAVIEDIVGGPSHLVGWSDGGIVSLLVALRRPDLVDRMVLIGANYHHEGILPIEIPRDSPFAAQMFQDYADRSPDGAEHFEQALGKAFTLFATEPTLDVDQLRTIAAPTLVLVGDDDLIRLDHTCSLYEALPAGQLAVVPRTSHAVVIEQPETCAQLIVEFLAAELPPVTIMPARRAR